MRFVGLVLVLVGLAAGYFLGYLGLTIDQARARLAQLLNLPGLGPPAPSASTANGTGPTISTPITSPAGKKLTGGIPSIYRK